MNIKQKTKTKKKTKKGKKHIFTERGRKTKPIIEFIVKQD